MIYLTTNRLLIGSIVMNELFTGVVTHAYFENEYSIMLTHVFNPREICLPCGALVFRKIHTLKQLHEELSQYGEYKIIGRLK